MAFKKTFRKFAKKGIRRYAKRTGNGKKMKINTHKIARDLAYVKSVLNTEFKYATVQYGSHGDHGIIQVNESSPQLLDLFSANSNNWLTKGTDSNNRVGDRIRVTSVTNKIMVTFRNVNNTCAVSNCKIYMLYFYDAQKTPTISDILEQDSENKYTQESLWNQQYKGNYRIIRRYNFTQPHSNTGTNQMDMKVHRADHFQFSFKPEWDGDTLMKGRFWLMAISDNDSTSDNIRVNLTQKINYVDN